MLAAWWLILASLFFYGWWNWRLLGLLGGSVMLNYLAGNWLERYRSQFFLGLCIAANLAAIGWFKYANLLVGTAAELLGRPSLLLDIVLPLAISFSPSSRSPIWSIFGGERNRRKALPITPYS